MSEDENKIEMTEGEAIELLKEYVAYTKQARSPYETDKATEMLLDLYQQEKEKNEELNQIKCGIKILQNNGLDDEQYIVIANKNLKNTSYKNLLDDYVSKDKIRSKIEEVKRKREEEWKTAGISMLGSAIDVLIELLEEE